MKLGHSSLECNKLTESYVFPSEWTDQSLKASVEPRPKIFIPTPDIPVYNPTPISELEKRRSLEQADPSPGPSTPAGSFSFFQSLSPNSRFYLNFKEKNVVDGNFLKKKVRNINDEACTLFDHF